MYRFYSGMSIKSFFSRLPLLSLPASSPRELESSYPPLTATNFNARPLVTLETKVAASNGKHLIAEILTLFEENYLYVKLLVSSTTLWQLEIDD